MTTTLTNTLPESFWCDIYKLVKEIPSSNDELMPGIKWGCYSQIYTPAFWKTQYLIQQQLYESTISNYKLGKTLIEEVVACLLGGYGMRSELGELAYQRLQNAHLIKPEVSLSQIYSTLSTPFKLSNGNTVTYRFYNQKSKYIHAFLNRNDLHTIPVSDDFKLREWLLSINGIGMKTASWITRNWLDSNNVAILDIHILRAGAIAGFYPNEINNLSKHYLHFEQIYLQFCKALDVSSSILDSIIWNFMKKTNTLAISVLNKYSQTK